MKKIIEFRYSIILRSTIIEECIYDEEGKETERNYIWTYPGKPDIEKTKARYAFVIETLRGGVVDDDIEFREWTRPQWKLELDDLNEEIPEEESKIELTEEDYLLFAKYSPSNNREDDVYTVSDFRNDIIEMRAEKAARLEKEELKLILEGKL